MLFVCGEIVIRLLLMNKGNDRKREEGDGIEKKRRGFYILG